MAAIAVEHKSFDICHAKVKCVAIVMGLVTSDSTHSAFAQLSMHDTSLYHVLVISFMLSRPSRVQAIAPPYLVSNAHIHKH